MIWPLNSKVLKCVNGIETCFPLMFLHDPVIDPKHHQSCVCQCFWPYFRLTDQSATNITIPCNLWEQHQPLQYMICKGHEVIIPPLEKRGTHHDLDCMDNILQWRHNGHDGISNHRRSDCSLNSLFRRRSKKTSKLHATALCEENTPVSRWPAQRASNTENVSIWWCHHDLD